jgi:hypothetical protein
MKNFTTQQLKDAMVALYPKKDDLSCAAYRLAFDLLEAKIGEEKFNQFLEAYGL